MKSTAWISYCTRYRYTLTREWDAELWRVCFVMLKPSTADEKVDDTTIRRCIRFGRDWGCGSLEVDNRSPVRSSDPKRNLEEWPAPVHYRSTRGAIADAAKRAQLVVLAWGAHKTAKLPSMSHGL